MRRLVLSRVYLMKCLGFILLYGFIALGTVGGCSNNGGGQNGARALTENDLAEDSTISHDPFGSIFVTILEHPNRPDGDNQSTPRETGLDQTRDIILAGAAGADQIPFNFNETTNHTFCYEDENNPDAEHTAILLNEIGQEIAQFVANGDCVELIVEAGKYILEITHDGKIEDVIPLFMISESINNTAKNNHAVVPLLKYAQNFKQIFLNKINLFKNTNANAQTQTVLNNTQTLIQTNGCPGCNLTGANLHNYDLFQEFSDPNRGLIIVGADLQNAILTDADLSEATLCGVDLTGATLDNTNFEAALWVTATCPTNFVFPCDYTLTAVTGSSTTAVTCDLNDSIDIISINDLKTVCNKGSIGQCNLIDDNTIMMVQAWGGTGGRAGIDSGPSNGGLGGYSQAVGTMGDFITQWNSSFLFYYLGEAGPDSSHPNAASGGASTAVLWRPPVGITPDLSEANNFGGIEINTGAPTAGVIVLAGGGGGGSTTEITDPDQHRMRWWRWRFCNINYFIWCRD